VQERIIITIAILSGLSFLSLAWQGYKTRLAKSIAPTQVASNSTPTLLWFTAAYCAPCKFQQGPIMQTLAEKFGNTLHIRQIDVGENPDLARQYKVMTLPTTVVLNASGEVAHINYGVASQAKLEAQLA